MAYNPNGNYNGYPNQYPQSGAPPPAAYAYPQPPQGGYQYPPAQAPPQNYQYPPQQPPVGNYYPQQQPTGYYPAAAAPAHPQPGMYPPVQQNPHMQHHGAQTWQTPHPVSNAPVTNPATGQTYVPSLCTGKKKALLIGINYFNQRGQLRGCINDVKNMSNFLMERFGYKREDMVILTDDQQNPKSQPTRQNILQAMHWLVKGAEPNDSLFFHYSGHGGQTKDLDGDENDGYDETIYPVDFRYNGHIVDDDMHAIMVAPLKAGVRLTAIFDSCHSGSALDLPYLYSTQGQLKEGNLIRDAGEGLIDALGHYARGDVSSVFATGASIIKKVTSGSKAEAKAKKTKTSAADVIQWSGSKDTQKSADTTEGGEATGAMSYAFISALKKNPQQSYQQLLQNIRVELQGKYAQKPQLSCSHPLGTDEDLLAYSQSEFSQSEFSPSEFSPSEYTQSDFTQIDYTQANFPNSEYTQSNYIPHDFDPSSYTQPGPSQ